MNVSIFGLGYVGAVSLACLARDRHSVVGVDIDQAKLDLIAAGKTPVVEEGMVDLMRDVVASGRVAVTTNAHDAVMRSEISLVCVGTPSAPNGSQNQSAMLRLAEEIGAALGDKAAPHTIVIRSTVVPGTVEGVLLPIIERRSGKKEGVDFHLCFQPEFLREGSSIRDYDKPPFTIVGARAAGASDKLRELFGHLPCQFHATTIRAAEMVKYCCNNFHALKITFANETARLCEAMDIDPFEVMDLVCNDRQLNISQAYLRPGFAFGGSCLPKDLRALTYRSARLDVKLPFLESVLPANQAHLNRAIQDVLDLSGKRIGMIGLAFKENTDDLRESPVVSLLEHLIGKGRDVRVFDPHINLDAIYGSNRDFILTAIPHIGRLLESKIENVLEWADHVVLAQPPSVEMAQAIRDSKRPVLDLVGSGLFA